MIHENTYKNIDFNGAKGIVFLGDKMLTYRRDNKTYSYPFHIDLPGGGREGNESPFDTFKREVKEEFGIDIEKNDIEFSWAIQSTIRPDKTSYFFVTKSLVLNPSEIIFGDEGIEWLLMTPEEFIKRPDGIERQQKRVEKFLNGVRSFE